MKGRHFLMKKNKLFTKLYQLYDKLGIYLLAFGIVLLNFSIAFDNVVWGDEAYSQMAIKNCSLYGIFERVYYWDSHPPLYYYYLRLFADLFGYKTAIYHIASLIPFTIGILIACTLFKKYIGTIPATFFIIISGLSESCSEYNLEIRMYSLVFLFVLLCAYCSYRLIQSETKQLWFFMTLWGIWAAYTHYFGLLICGLIILFTGCFYFLMHRKNTWIYGLIATGIYILVYIPWLFVLYRQTQSELNDSWMTVPEKLSRIIRFISGGSRLMPIVFSFCVLMSIALILIESRCISIDITVSGIPRHISLQKPNVKNWSTDFISIILFWVIGIVLLGFSYAVSYLFHPILAFRYTYVIIPLVLFIFMLCMKKLIEYMTNSIRQKLISVLILCMLCATLLLSLLDFKYFRSVTKTQDYQTNLILEMIGTPHDDAVFIGNGVKHLAWSVLKYYYPDNEVTYKNPIELEESPSEIWAFMGYELDQEILDEMEKRGYIVSPHMDMWLGKYGVNLYHFYMW